MAEDKNIKNFTATDIERYHKGSLSVKERHDLERAALDDPFLADALEGYAVAADTMQSDLAELRSRLDEKVEGAKVVALPGKKRKAIPWLRVAALVIIIAGAALLANQFIFNKNSDKNIAKVEQKSNEAIVSTDSSNGSLTATDNSKTPDTGSGYYIAPSNGSTTKTDETIGTTSPNKVADNKTKNYETLVKTEPAPVANNDDYKKVAPAGAEEKVKSEDKDIAVKNAIKENNKGEIAVDRKKPDTDGDGVKDKFDAATPAQQKRNETVATSRRAVNDSYQSNTFRGRVTDSNNVGVPFANVTNAQDNNAGTYTDAKGFFNLTYPDTVLTVQVRSIGFENTNVQLRNAVPNNQVVLLDDRKSLSEVVISNQKPNAVARNRDANVKFEEPEPADGWENYDAYLANNLIAPEEIKTKQTVGGQVQLSFEVNKYGEPINIKVEKSLCSKCNDEAIRLIKDGPKWIRNTNKKARTTVTINF